MNSYLFQITYQFNSTYPNIHFATLGNTAKIEATNVHEIINAINAVIGMRIDIGIANASAMLYPKPTTK